MSLNNRLNEIIKELRANINSSIYYKKRAEYEAEEKRRREEQFKQRLINSGLSVSDYEDLREWRFLKFAYGRGKHSESIRGKIASWYKGGYKRKPFLVLYGNKGTGKTTIAKKITLSWMHRFNVFFVKKSRLDLMLYNFGELNEVLQELMEVNLLVLDDFGTGYDTDYRMAHIFSLLDERYNKNRPTIITTNLNLIREAENIDETREKGSLRDFSLMVDRLKEKGFFVEFDYPSLRDETIKRQALKGRIRTVPAKGK